MSKKNRDLLIVWGIYLLAFAVGYIPCIWIEDLMLRCFVFDVVATVVTFVFSVILKNSSVYDAYWSLTPAVISIYLFAYMQAFNVWQILFLIIFNIWSFRLTINWVTVFTDFTYEDWRYKKYRDESPKIFWPVVNFFGIHMMPTLVVFAGMLPLFEIAKGNVGALSIPGMIVILWGVMLEFLADREMHAFLKESKGKEVCKRGIWRYSRHPNYLGEMSVWVGVFFAMIPYAPTKWFYGIGFASIVILFNVVSVPLMEKRQLARRKDYAQYKKETSRLLLLPVRKAK